MTSGPRSLAPALVLAALLASLGGCGVEQAAECETYVSCQAAYDAAFGIEPATDTTDYDDGGRCWFGNVETAETCAALCENATAALANAAAQAGQSLPACEG